MVKRVKTLVFGLIFGICSAAAGFSFEAKSIVGESLYNQLRQKECVQRTYYKKGNVTPALAPNTAFVKKTVASSWTSSDAPCFVAENLYLLPKSKLSADPSVVTIEESSRVIRRVSTMKGLTYYSSNDKKWETLYKDAYCIAGPQDRTRVADNTAGSANGKVAYCMLNDNSFGKTNYVMKYSQSDDEVCANFVSTTAMFVGPVKAVEAGNLTINLNIIDCGEDLLVYMLIKTKFPAMDILENMLTDSFTSRLDAIYRWFTKSFK